MWNKWIIDRIYCANSHINLNKVGVLSMELKCHRQYYINILVSGYLSFNWKERIAIDKAGSRSMEWKRHWQYNIHILVSIYLSFYWQGRLAIDKSGSQSMKQKRYRQVISYFKSQYLKSFKYLEFTFGFEIFERFGLKR